MENQSYEEAAATYESILRSSPGDAEAVAGLREAHEKIIESQLIQIRMTRMSGNPEGAAHQLLELIQREDEWKVQPKGKVAFTQNEESELAADHIIKKLSDAIKSNFPLQFEHLSKKYQIFSQEHKSQQFKNLKDENNKHGKSECHRLAKTSYEQFPYLAEFVTQYCSYWGENVSLSGYLPENKFKNLFRDLNVSVSIQRYPNELVAGLQLSLVDAFKRSPWFHSQGRSVLLAKTSGEHQYDQQKIAIQLVHEYYVDERYVSYEDVRKTRQVPYDTYESHYNYINKTYEERRVTKYRNEEYWIKEPVERTRRITKYFPYGAWKISQVLGLTLSGESLVESKNIRWNLNDRVTQEDTMSEIRMADIGLSPKEPKKISNREDWLKDKTSQFSKEFEGTLGKAWEEAYCVEDSNSKNFNYIGNRVRKCLRKEFATPPTFVKDWYIKNFGLEVQEVTKLLQAVR